MCGLPSNARSRPCTRTLTNDIHITSRDHAGAKEWYGEPAPSEKPIIPAITADVAIVSVAITTAIIALAVTSADRTITTALVLKRKSFYFVKCECPGGPETT